MEGCRQRDREEVGAERGQSSCLDVVEEAGSQPSISVSKLFPQGFRRALLYELDGITVH